MTGLVAAVAAVAACLAFPAVGAAYQPSDLAPTSVCPVTSPTQLLCLHNWTRRQHGLVALKADPKLYAAARRKETRIVACGQFTHYPCGDNPFEYFPADACGTCGENLAYGYPTIRATYTAWLDSPGHLANIVNPAYRYYGSAVRDNAPRSAGPFPYLWLTDFSSNP